ncbi:MAG: hypothetical protein HAW66_01685 [Shewanella sp.]|nr:hypothetical protein [Shewanella sp.]
MFVFGSILSLFSLSLRLTLTETPAFLNTTSRQPTSPIKTLFTRHRQKILKGIIIASLPAVGISTLYEMINYSSSLGDKNNSYSVWVFTSVSLGAIVFGKISDIIGRVALIRSSCVAFLLLPVSFNRLDTIHLYAAFIPLILGTALISGCYTACLTELMPTNVRFTGIATCHNFAFAFFGGLTPLLLESLIQNNHASSLAFIPAIVAIPVFITSFYWTDKYNLSLSDEKI